jgi:KaiC/GvpD/RAD55 family RecA-like ATPase
VTYPEGHKTGAGAKSRWITQLAGIQGHLDVEYKEWIPDKYIRVHNVGPYFHNSGGSFTLSEEEEKTLVNFEIHYEIPFSIVGRILDRLVISRELEAGFERGFRRMKDALEGTNPIRVPTGILGLDLMLDKGLPKGSWVLVVGPPGSGKSALSRQFLYAATSRGCEAVLLTTRDSTETVRQSMASLGWNAPELERVQVIDCYSWRESDRRAIDLRNLTGTSIGVAEFFKNMNVGPEQDPCLVIDSLTDFLLNNEPAAALKFLAQLKSKLQAEGITTLVLLEEGVHEKNTVATAEYLMDGTIHTKFDKTGRYLMVNRMFATPVQPMWRKFDIKKTVGIIMEESSRSTVAEQKSRAADMDRT